MQGNTRVGYPFPSFEESDREAVQLKRHGYNLVRFQYLDRRLMYKRETDFDIDPVELDRFFYELAALKRQGIYWSLDLMSDTNGLLAKQESLPQGPNSIAVRSNFDPKAREHWVKLVDTIFNVRNPYTGLTTLEDPALAMVVPINESSIGFWSAMGASRTRPFPDDMQRYFNAWAMRVFGTTEALRKDMPGLGADERIEDGTLRLPANWDETSPRMSLFLRFVSDQEVETYDWMRGVLAERGYHGIALAFHDWYRSLNNRTRARLPVIDVHGYIGVVPSFALGNRWSMPSSLDNDITDYRAMLANRWLDKPFVVTEYGHPFWNPYRYEAGIVFPALAALQGTEFICRLAHTSIALDVPPADSGVRAMLPFSIGLDPVARAGETLSLMLFHRGDVKAATGIVAVPFGEREFSHPGSGNLPSVVRMASLLTRFGLIPDDKVKALGSHALILPLGTSEIMNRLVGAITGKPDSRLETMVASLRANGTLSPSNVTDPKRHIYESATNEIHYDGEKRTFSVVTPKTEAIAFSGVGKPISLGQLTVMQASSGALVGASALDDLPLAESRRILLVMAGDAINSNMKFADDKRTTILDWGSMPILIQRVTAEIQLKLPGASNAKLTVLGLNGVPIGTLPVILDKNGLARLTLDVGAVPSNPTTFFLLERS